MPHAHVVYVRQQMWSAAVGQSSRRCELCGVLESDRLAVGGRDSDTRVVVHADAEVVVLVGPTAKDVLVTPRHHLARLPQTSALGAPALAAMRVVVNVLRSVLGVAGATVEPTHEIGGADHISFRVVPSTTGARREASHPDIDTMVSLLSGALERIRPVSSA